MFIQDDLPHADILGRELHAFIPSDVFQGFLHRELHRRCDARLVVRARGADIAQLLVLITFTSRSSWREFSPITCPA
jgi:hypothetical protein